MPKTLLCAVALAALANSAVPQILDVRELNTRQIGALDRARTVVLISGPRAMDPIPPDPDLPAIIDGSAKHEREVERKEEDWLAKRRR